VTCIDSPTNPRVREALRAVESGERLLLEGSRALGEALASGVVVTDVFVHGDEGTAEADVARQAAEQGAASFSVSSRVLRKLSDLPSARGLVALAEPPRRSLEELHRSGSLAGGSMSSSLFVLLDGVQDPANVGAILRSAEAFGVHGILLTPACASPFSPKALRASALSALRIPTAPDVEPDSAIVWAARGGAVLVAAEPRGGEPPEALRAVRPLVLVIGSEGRGISASLESRISRRVSIPLSRPVESLNAAVAAGVLLHAITRG
jgi:tRNA G18 (ribose-2'-O)-methylase SpoU